MGRTTMLSRALGFADRERDVIVRPEPSGQKPFAALCASFACALPSAAALSYAARAIAARAGGKRLVIAVDDAHLLDSASLLAFREVSRLGKALLLVTSPLTAGPPIKPDPTDCLRYETGFQLITLQPLSVGEVAAALAGAMGGPVAQPTAEAMHAATGGNPRWLRGLVDETSLAAYIVRRGNTWRLGATDSALQAPRDAGPDASPDARPDAARITDAAWSAWRELACDRADQLCRLALWCGAPEGVAPIWATLLLLSGHPADALAFLEGLPDEQVVETPRLVLVKALTLAIGLHRVEEASEFLARAADRTDSARLILAYRAWILTVTGHATKVADGPLIDRRDMETAMFVHATRATLARMADRPAEAVFHLRRALATAETGSGECPWMRPFLTASLIDSMLLSGRVREAASIAQRFHGGARGSGWDLAVALDVLMRRAGQNVSALATTTPGSS